MNKDVIIAKLSAWKEKILFGVIVLATLAVAMKGRPLSSEVVVDTDSQQREAAIKKANIERDKANQAVDTLREPPDWSPVQVDGVRVDRPFFDDEDIYTPTRASAWRLSQATYESLPPLTLSPPGFIALPDYDLPAGPHPEFADAGGYIPRDARPVTLTAPGSSEFD